MPLFRINGKKTKGSRLAKRERSTKNKHEKIVNGEPYLHDRRLQLHKYDMRQNRRWLTAKIHTEGDDDIPYHVRFPLLQHWSKTEHHQQNPKISDGLALTDDVKSALALLRDERAVAAAKQRNPERVADWWVQPQIKSKREKSKKEEKGKNAKKQGPTAGQGVIGEGLGDDVGALELGEDEEMDEEMDEEIEEEEGGVLLKEDLAGFDSSALMSSADSEVGDGEEEEEEEGEEDE